MFRRPPIGVPALFKREILSIPSIQQCRHGSIMGALGPAAGSTKHANRLGRGPGSGSGKTSGRGQKGQKARGSVKHWFEGGQTRITKLFPKVGFKSKVPDLDYINLGTIQTLIDKGRLDPSKPITMRELYRSRACGRVNLGVKILAGKAYYLKTKINISASEATKGAIKRIEELNGTFRAEYYTPLGLKTLTRPEAVYRRYGRIPLRARPIDRASIEYYRDPERRGYLVGAPNAPSIKKPFVRRPRKNPLATLVETLAKDDPSASVVKGFIRSSAGVEAKEEAKAL